MSCLLLLPNSGSFRDLRSTIICSVTLASAQTRYTESFNTSAFEYSTPNQELSWFGVEYSILVDMAENDEVFQDSSKDEPEQSDIADAQLT